MLDFKQFKALTFDCYGTLIDWETGILGGLRPLAAAHRKEISDVQMLALYGELESEIEGEKYRKYRDVLREVVRRMGARLGFQASEREMDSLPDSLKDWAPFPDTVAALRRLKARYQLAIISNTDDALFAETAKLLQVRFDQVITAEQAGAYKPSHKNFQMAFERLKLPKAKILHVGQSRHHDIAPALELGLKCVLVTRRGRGAVVANAAEPDLEVPDLKSLADAAGV